MTLDQWQKESLPRLRSQTLAPSRHAGVTIIIYTFPPPGKEDVAFRGIECAILQTWSVLGLLPTIIVADRRFPALDAFLDWVAGPAHESWHMEPGAVRLVLSPVLVPGDIRSMSLDCITHLKDYFSTPSCLVIQNDGFPLRDNLDDFLGKYDYIGAPTNVSWRRRFLFRPFGLMTFNGGFSLRSHRICEAAAAEWQRWGRHLIRPHGRLFAEDVFYTTTAKLDPFYRFRFRFPSLDEALRFSYDDLLHRQDLPAPSVPLGFHGVTTAEQYLVKNLEDIVFVSVVRDKKMFELCLTSNHVMRGIRFVALDNSGENRPVSVRYNEFLDSYDYSHTAWMAFCHEDFEPLEDARLLLWSLDKNCIYGPIGARRVSVAPDLCRWQTSGSLLESEKDGTGQREVGNGAPFGTPVDTLDCCCLLVHSSMVQKTGLRFDPRFSFDLYVEDFCIQAREQKQVLVRILPWTCRHHSIRRQVPPSYGMALRKLNEKWPQVCYAGTCSWLGGDRLARHFTGRLHDLLSFFKR